MWFINHSPRAPSKGRSTDRDLTVAGDGTVKKKARPDVSERAVGFYRLER